MTAARARLPRQLKPKETGDKLASPSALSKRVERLEEDLGEHQRNDQDQFAALRLDNGAIRKEISELSKSLNEKIGQLGSTLHNQIDAFRLDKAKAEGRAEALAEARKPNPWALAIAPVVVGLLLGAIVSWAARDQIQGGLGTQGRATTTTTVTTPLSGSPR